MYLTAQESEQIICTSPKGCSARTLDQGSPPGGGAETQVIALLPQHF